MNDLFRRIGSLINDQDMRTTFTNRHLVKFSTSDIEFPIPQDQPQRIRSTTSVKSVFRPGNINFPCFHHGRRVKYNDLVIVRSGCISFRGRNESDRSTHRSSRRHFQTSFHFQSSIILPGVFYNRTLRSSRHVEYPITIRHQIRSNFGFNRIRERHRSDLHILYRYDISHIRLRLHVNTYDNRCFTLIFIIIFVVIRT